MEILISTIDGYSVVWRGFYHSLKKYWPDSWPIMAITNYLEFPCGCTIKTGKSLNWSDMMRKALSYTSYPVILFVTEDTWLTAPPDVEALDEFASVILDGRADHVRLRPPLKMNPKCDFADDPRLFVFADDETYRCSLQAGLWDVKALMGLLRNDALPGDFEIRGSLRSRGNDRFLCAKTYDYFPHVTAGFEDWNEAPVVRGKWTRAARIYAKRERLDIDFFQNPKGGL